MNKFLKYCIAFFTQLILGLFLLSYFILPWYVGSNENIFLPDLTGKFQHNALSTLEELKFDVKVVNIPYDKNNKPGTVTKMFPRAHTKVKKGRLVTISIAGHKKNISIPDFLNISLRNAKIKLSDLSLNIDTVMYEFNPEVKNDHVAFQVPSSGSIVKSGSYITLGVSKGTAPDYFIIPDLINFSLKLAKEKIRIEGLRIGEIEYIYKPEFLNNTIIDQSYPPGLEVPIPVKIDLIVSKDINEE